MRSTAARKPKQPPHRSPQQSRSAAASSGKASSNMASDAPPSAPAAGTGLDVTPCQGEFINFDVDTTYVMAFTICNRTRELQTLRFIGPQSANTAFRLVNLDSVRLAPGLSHVVDVEFTTHVTVDYHDCFTILRDDGVRLEVPLAALSVPELKYDPIVDFGRVEHHRTGAVKQLRLLNRGRKDAMVNLTVTTEKNGISINPSTVLAKALGETSVIVELSHHMPPGKHAWEIAVNVDGMCSSDPLKAIVNVVDSRSTLLDPRTNTEAVSVVFRQAYAGTKTRYPLRVINGSEQGVSFAFQLANELFAKDAPPFRFMPEQGRLGPKESLEVVVIFEPPLSPIRQGWSCRQEESCRGATHKFESLFSLLFVETEQTHNFHVTAESLETVLSLSKSVMDFGECAMDDYRNEEVVLHNGVGELPLGYEFDRVPNFRVNNPSGVVPPNGSVTLVVTYQPRRMGHFSERLKVVFNGTVSRAITLIGHAIASKGKAKLVGGVDKLPIDFVRKPQPPRIGGASSSAAASAHADASQSPFIAAVDLPQEVDIGMIPSEGLRPPQPIAASGQKDLLAEDSGLHLAHGHVAPVTFDTKALIKRRYAEEPASALERRDCRRELMPMDLLKVVTPIKVLDFERVTVGAAATRSFFVYNGTDASIIVAMPTHEPHIEFTPLTQVIPALRMGHFDVRLCSSVVQSCQQVIPFTINSRHQMRVSLEAEVVPVEVTLSQSDLVLNFAEFTDDPVTHAHVVLQNSGNSSAPFRFRLPPKVPFTITPMDGVLEPMSKITAEITFTPPQGVLEVECEAVLEVEGALGEKTMRLRGVVAATKCMWNKIQSNVSGDAVLDLRRIPAGKETTTTLTLLNRGSNDAFFSFDSLPSGVHITPSNGRICAGEAEELLVSVRMEAAGPIQQTVLCNVRGMRKPLRMQISANIVVPPLTVTLPELVKGEIALDFQETYVGWQSEREISFFNSGDVPAVIQMDLRAVSNFKLVGKRHVLKDGKEAAKEGGVDMSATSATAGASASRATTPEVTLRRWSVGSQSSSDSVLSDDEHFDHMDGIFLATLPAQTETTLAIVFSPDAVVRRDRYYVHWHQIGADDIHPLPPLVLSAIVLPMRLQLSTTVVDFPSVVSGRVLKPALVTVRNVSSETTRWSLLSCKQAQFLLEPNSGELEPNASETVNITFLANDVGTFAEALHLYADQDTTKPCAALVLNATATKPRLICSTQAILFPSIPLDTVVSETMYITNEGFDAIEVIYEAENYSPVKVDFPDGNLLSRSTGSIPVTVSFSSQKPITVASSIILRTNASEVLELKVTGTAINSIFTTQGFVLHREWQITNAASSWDVERAQSFSVRPSKSSVSPTSFPEASPQAPAAMVPFRMVDAVGRHTWSRQAPEDAIVSRWLSYNLIRRPAGTSLVEALQSSHGMILYDAIERMFGKRPRRPAAAAAAGSGEHVSGTSSPASGARMRPSIVSVPQNRRRMQSLEVLIDFMKSYGCCLSSVQIIYLLPYDEYVAACLPTEGRVLDVLQFNVRAMHAWSTVVLEMVRVFYMSKFTPDGLLRTSPGIASCLPADAWTSRSFKEALSNSPVYSTEESCLLQWVRATVGAYCERENSVFPIQKMRVSNFDDLRDVRGYVAAVLTYVPSFRWMFLSGNNRQFVPQPTTLGEMEANAQLLMTALQELGMSGLPSGKAFMEFSQIDLVLFTAFLASYLPRFVPSSTVQFEGKLLSTITQTIEVSNTSPNTRQYRVHMDNTEFKCAKELTVSGGGSASLEIHFTPRYHRVVEGICLVIDTSAVMPDQRVPLAFKLRATPNSEPTKVLDFETALYEPLHATLPIESPFTQDCVVNVRMTQRYVDPVPVDGAPVAPRPERELASNFKKIFFVSTDVLPLRRNEPTSLPFYCIPFCRGEYEAVLTFRDDREGEFSYLIRVQCTPPRMSDVTVEFRTEMGEECFPTVPVKANNPALERASRLYEDKQRQSQGIVRSAPTTDLSTNAYEVQFLNDSMEGPSPFFKMMKNAVVMSEGSNGSTDLRFEFVPKYVGKYSGYILLSSPIDIRLIRFLGECVPTGERRILKFTCPARQSISQDITITNHSEEDWLVSAALEGDCFSGPRELRIPKGKQKDYVIKYAPQWISTSDKGMLTLLNKTSGQKHTYDLTAVAEAPLCEDVLYVECRAREKQTLSLTVPNVSANDCTYFVETDLPFSEGDATIITRRASFAKYTLVVTPTVGGNYCGKIVFRSHQGRYVWYIVNLSVTPPEKEGIVELTTDLRTSVVAEVSITNPLKKDLSFFVRRYGPGLVGDNALEIGAEEIATYCCTFTPVQVGEYSGRLSFYHDDIGEYWYELKMTVVDSPPEELFFESTLGIPASNYVKLPNMSDTECPLIIQNERPSVLQVHPSVISIPPHSEMTVEITYTPTAVGIAQGGLITLSHPLLGQWKYACSGRGTPPLPNEKRSCVCEMLSNTTMNIAVTNTLGVPTPLSVTLAGNKEGFFSVRGAPQGTLAAGATASITLLYAPRSVGNHAATVEVRPQVGATAAEYNVCWSYPVEGRSEWRETSPFRFHCTARKELSDVIMLRVPGLTPEEKEDATLRFEPDAKQHYLSAITSSFECELVEDCPYPDAFQARVKFSPLRPMAASGDLIIAGKNGGSWRYRVYLEASSAAVDDTISIVSTLYNATSVVFDLYNVFPYKSKFVAYFTGDSSKDFTVGPAHGVLLPFAPGQKATAAATPIKIRYRPSARVPRVEGTLVVDTEDMQWSFKVIGKLDTSQTSNKK